MKTHAINPAYDRSLPMMARLEARAESLGATPGAVFDAELLLDARSVINDLLASCYAVAALNEGQGRANMCHVAGQARAAIARAEGGARNE